MIRLTVFVAALLLWINAAFGRADDLNIFLRAAVGAPVEARVLWPPIARFSPGDLVGHTGAVVEFGTSEVHAVAVPATAAPNTLVLDRLDTAAFWPVRFLVDDLTRLSLTLRVRDAIRETAEGNHGSPSHGTRVGTVWRAVVTIEFSKVPDLSEERWNSLRQAALEDTTGTVKVRGSAIRLEPIERVPVAWSPLPGDRDNSTTNATGRRVAPKRWALLTVASGVYRDLDPSMNQDWNRESARLVREALSDWSPTLVQALDAKPGDGLTRDKVLAFVTEGMQQAKRARTDLVVVYYVGHQERSGTGGLSLLMSDAPAKRSNPPPAPATGVGNLRDLMQVIDQAQAELAPNPGTLDVAVVHRRMSDSGISFVLLVDGCLDDRSYAAARERLGIVVNPRGGEPIFVGPGNGGTALRAMIQQLENYASDFPWLRSRNVTVLGATPGTLAFSVPHPKWLLGAPVAPIAQRLAGVVARTRGEPDRPSLIRTLSFTADRQAIGPQELSGTVSWSDWLPHLRRFDPTSFR